MRDTSSGDNPPGFVGDVIISSMYPVNFLEPRYKRKYFPRMIISKECDCSFLESSCIMLVCLDTFCIFFSEKDFSYLVVNRVNSLIGSSENGL